jgi:hypothetical protein
VTVTGVKTVPLDEAQYYVPRCVDGSGGNCNLDRVNRKVRKYDVSRREPVFAWLGACCPYCAGLNTRCSPQGLSPTQKEIVAVQLAAPAGG